MARIKTDPYSCVLICGSIFEPTASAPAVIRLSFGERILGRQRQSFDHFALFVGQFTPILKPGFFATRATLLTTHIK